MPLNARRRHKIMERVLKKLMGTNTPSVMKFGDTYESIELPTGVTKPTQSVLEAEFNQAVADEDKVPMTELQGDVKIGSSNLYVDTSTGNVGIKTDTPAYDLDVHGTANVGVLTVTGNINITGNLSRTQYRPGEIIEEISSICDGSQIEAISGTYTIENVTGVQNGSSTHTAVKGSTISYTPPTGTKRVYYRFSYQWDCTENSGISHHQMQVDGTTLTDSRHTVASNYASTNWHHAIFPVFIEYTINCDASSTNAAAGKFTSWTSPKTLRVTYREYNGSYESRLHLNEWWDGSGTDRVVRPHLTIRAIA